MTLQNKNNNFIQKLSKFTLGLLLFLVCAYLILGFTFDRDFFARDASEKYGRVLGATTLRLRIIGPPGQPDPSATPLCDYLDAPFVRLAWDATSDTDDYYIERDGNSLVSGLTETTYDDYAVTSATDYSYVVTASGPVAPDTPSLPVVVTTNLCSALPDPIVEIDKLNENVIVDPQEILQTQDHTPTFYGHTNINNALIEIELNSSTPIIAQTVANENGFWEWTSPLELELGSHLLEVVAIDPLDPSRRESASLQFEVIAPQASSDDDDDDDHKKNRKKKTSSATIDAPALTAWPKINTNFTLALTVLNDDAVVFTGQELKTRLTVQADDPTFRQTQVIDYLILDSDGKIIFQTSSEMTVFREALVYKNIALPRLLKNGRYKVVAQTDNDGVRISAESFFRLQEAPLIVAGPVKFTLTELMANLGWIITILFLLLLIFLLLLYIEYWLYKHSVIRIDESFLERKGFLGQRKGVLR